jgi:hypothetical protein
VRPALLRGHDATLEQPLPCRRRVFLSRHGSQSVSESFCSHPSRSFATSKIAEGDFDDVVSYHFIILAFFVERKTSQGVFSSLALSAPFGWNYKPAEKHCWLIFCERKILFRLKKQAE